MTPKEIRAARKKLGLSQAGLAAWIGLGAHGDRTVRRWEDGTQDIPGYLTLLLTYALKHGIIERDDKP